jgi:hypothetical protein
MNIRIITGITLLAGLITLAALYPQTRHTSRAAYELQLAMKLKQQGRAMALKPDVKGSMDRPDMAALQDYYMTLDPALGRVPQDRRLKAWTETSRRAQLQAKSTNSLINWSIIPSNMGGRTRALLWDPNDASGNKVWAGAVTGGLWYNNNITSATSPWVPVNDFWPGLAISCIAYDPVNPANMYVGTGEAQTAVTIYRESSGRGYGIWHSTNGGVSWNLLPATQNFAYVTDIIVRNESGNAVIYAGVVSGKYMGADHQSMPTDGLYRSTDDGISWTQVLPNISGENKPWPVSDIALSADSARIFIGTMRNLDGKGGATLIYSDAGTTGSWMVNETFRIAIEGNTQFNMPGRVVLATAPSDPNVAYAAIAAGYNSGGFDVYHGKLIVKSSNKGVSWQPKNLPPPPSNQDNYAYIAWHALDLGVDPNDANRVWAGGLDLHRSNDGGTSWFPYSDWALMYAGGGNEYVHADQHMILFKPGSSTEAIFGSDGGVFYSANINDPMFPIFQERNYHFSSLQFYTCAQSPVNDELLGGLQDNGSLWYTGNDLSIFDMISGGDGAYCFFDNTIPIIKITSVYYNQYYVFNGTSMMNYIGDYSSGLFINPADFDARFKTIYANAGNMFGDHQDELLRIKDVEDTYIGEYIPLNTGSLVPYSHVKVSPHSTMTNTRVFVGTMAGRLFKLTNAQNIPIVAEIGSPAFPNAAISCVAVGPTEDTLLVTFSNYGVSSVWQTFDGGQNWNEIEGNLPDMPVRWAIYHPDNPGQAMIATESGVWQSSSLGNANTYWAPCNDGLANVRVDMLQIRESDNKVVAATHGRGLATGIYQFDPTTQAVTINEAEARIYPNPSKGLFYLSGLTASNAILSVYGTDGRKMIENNISMKGTTPIDLQKLPKGAYWIKIVAGKKDLLTNKIIID